MGQIHYIFALPCSKLSTQRISTNGVGHPTSMFKYKKVTTQWNDSYSELTMQQIGTNGGWESTSIFKCKKVNTQWIHSELTHTANWPIKRIGTNPHRHWCKFAAWTNLLHGVKFVAWWLFCSKTLMPLEQFTVWTNTARNWLSGVKTAAWWLFCTWTSMLGAHLAIYLLCGSMHCVSQFTA